MGKKHKKQHKHSQPLAGNAPTGQQDTAMPRSAPAAQMDIHAQKALFEYEMTEVILMLKGEFAAVSGKALGYAAHHVSEEKRNAPLQAMQTQIPPVAVQQVGIPHALSQKLAKIRAAKPNPVICSTVSVVKPQLALPQVAPCVCTIPALPAKAPQPLAIPAVSPVQIRQIPPVRCAMPQLALPAISAAPSAAISPVSVAGTQLRIPAVPHFCTTQIRVEPKAIAVAVPPVPAFTPAPNLTLRTQAAAAPALPAVSVPKVTIPAVSFHSGTVALPAVCKPPVAKASGITLEKMPPISLPAARRTPTFSVKPAAFSLQALPNPRIPVPHPPRYTPPQAAAGLAPMRISLPTLPDLAKERAAILGSVSK